MVIGCGKQVHTTTQIATHEIVQELLGIYRSLKRLRQAEQPYAIHTTSNYTES